MPTRPLWREPGWPVNHTGPALALIARIYARHFSWLDLMPLWSNIDVSGFGSPMPVLYHKLFYVMAGALTLATGSAKSADVFVVALLLVAGATGLYLTTRALDASRLAATAAGCSLITANYTVTNWLVRGALAEFCGAMLVPWVLLYFVKAIQRGRLPIGLGLALGLLWLSHSVLAFYVGLLLAVTYLLLVVWRLAPLSALRPRTAWRSVMYFVLLVGPYLLPMIMLGRPYDMTRILTRPYRPVYQFVTPSYYLWDSHWKFGRTAIGLTVQLDHAMLLLMATGLCALYLRKPGTADTVDRTRWRVLQPTLPFLVVAALGLLL